MVVKDGFGSFVLAEVLVVCVVGSVEVDVIGRV